MKWTIETIRERLEDCVGNFCFRFHGVDCDIEPFRPDLLTLTCGGDSVDVNSIDDALNMPFFCGEELKNIFREIEVICF